MDLNALDSKSRFAAPNRALSPSPSPSPNRWHPSRELDPLLSNLSPTSTLEALEVTQAVRSSGNTRSSILRESVAAASTAERALGIKAALAAQKTKEWYKELKAWPWPTTEAYSNGFEFPSKQGRSKNSEKDGSSQRLDEVLQNTRYLDGLDDVKEEAYWGSLPAKLVQEYEDRIEEISDDVDMLRLDELKDYVRDVHLTTGSRHSSLQAPERNSGHATSYNHLDDFTAVITATIMQALPTITQLYLLLDTWSVRLAVLRQVPGFLASLEESQIAIKSGWNAVGKSETITENSESEISREAFTTMRNVLETRISDLGRRLDIMLDMLEGREEVLPEKWIDSMDNIEAEYGTWVMETETQVLDIELRKDRSEEAVEAKQTKYRHNSDIQGPTQEPQGSGGEEGCELIEEHSVKDASANSDPDSQFPALARSISGTTQGLRPLNQSEPETIEPDDSIQDPLSRSSNPHAETSLLSSPGRSSAAGSRKVESTTASTGRVYNLLSGLLGHEIADKSSVNPDDRTDHRPVTQDIQLCKSPSQRKPASAAPGASPGQQLSSNTFHLSESFIAPEGPSSKRDMSRPFRGSSCEVDAVPTFSVSLPDTPAVASLPVNKMEILDTLEAELLEQKHGPAARPGPIVFHKSHSRAVSNVSSDMSPDTSYPGSATSEYFSNMSSPEIRDASMAEYFTGPVKVTTPSHSSKDPMSPRGTVSRRSSEQTERGDSTVTESLFPSSFMTPTTQRSRASTVKNDLGANDIVGFRDGFFPSPGQPESESRARSASDTSTDVAPNSVAHNFISSQNKGYLSTAPGHWHSEKEYLGTGQPLTSALLRLRDEESASTATQNLTQPVQLQEGLRLASESLSKGPINPGDQPAVDSPPPIPQKSRHRFEDVSDLGPGSTPIKVRQRNRADLKDTRLGAPKCTMQSLSRTRIESSNDQLEARISSILTDIPARIRLTSGPEADAPEVLGPGGPKDPQTPATGSPAMRLLRSQSSVPSPPMTLAPAHPKPPQARTQNSDPEIRLYHLHQSGKAAPIKLYVRLVGENGERVMVRIGGGWADLGEYLKEYATHHGRRSVSDGRFEIQGLPRSQSSSPATASTVHPGSHDTPRSRPSSPSLFGSRNRRLSELASSDFGTSVTPETPSYIRQDSMPRSRESSPASVRPSSRQSWTEDDPSLGLAGPRTKKVEISPRKQAWVDDMVDQARNASIEKKKAGECDFGDLGKVGGTKRVFLKSK